MNTETESNGDLLKEITKALSKDYTFLVPPEIKDDVVTLVVAKNGWTGTYYGAFRIESTIEATIDRMLNRFGDVW
jgi:hypothetical protein